MKPRPGMPATDIDDADAAHERDEDAVEAPCEETPAAPCEDAAPQGRRCRKRRRPFVL
jgi:hypothetical protein